MEFGKRFSWTFEGHSDMHVSWDSVQELAAYDSALHLCISPKHIRPQ